MKLLVVEDEIDINTLICKFLRGGGLVVESATTYKEARSKVAEYDYDCIVLDLSLPDGDGLDLIAFLKKHHPETCIIVVSARNTIQDKINGLDLGADDYLAKPFSMAELNARIKSVFRRRKQSGHDQITFHELQMLTESREFFVNGKPVVLTPKEYDLLLYFMTNCNRVLTKENIVEHLWGDSLVVNASSFDFVYTHIGNLRRKIVEAGGHDYIKSVYSLGYKLSEA